MHIQPSFAHPSWCDPRICTADDLTADHRSAPMAWKSSTDDYWITTGLSRFDGLGECPHTGPVLARLELRDLSSDNPDGKERVIGSDLTAADARLLAAALITVAEQLEDLQRGQVAA